MQEPGHRGELWSHLPHTSTPDWRGQSRFPVRSTALTGRQICDRDAPACWCVYTTPARATAVRLTIHAQVTSSLLHQHPQHILYHAGRHQHCHPVYICTSRLLLLSAHCFDPFLHRDARHLSSTGILAGYHSGSLPPAAGFSTIVSRTPHGLDQQFLAASIADIRRRQACRATTPASECLVSCQLNLQLQLRLRKPFDALLQPVPTRIRRQHGPIRHKRLLLQPLREDDGLLRGLKPPLPRSSRLKYITTYTNHSTVTDVSTIPFTQHAICNKMPPRTWAAIIGNHDIAATPLICSTARISHRQTDGTARLPWEHDAGLSSGQP